MEPAPTSTAAGVAATAAAPSTVANADEAAYQDDGHIFVCVRVRDVPQNPCLTTSGNTNGASAPLSAMANGGGGGGGNQPRKTMGTREAQKICVSTLENIVVMHDPRSLDDASTVARDANNVVQLLTDRANAAAARPSARPSTRKSTGAGGGTRTRSSTGVGKKSAANRPLIGTQTANYYECDHCVTSMDEASMLRMPMIKNSDFLQPPAYGSQEDVYRATAMHAVSAAVKGINSCVFAYGQTGSGKTYTLFGDTANIRRDPGIVPRTLDDLFGQLDAVKRTHGANTETDHSYAVNLSFFEIYQNEVYCLFSRQGPLHVQFMRDPSGKKETMIISDLQQQAVTSAEKAYPLVEMGLRRRQTGETGMNARSSRSHAILQIRVAQWYTNRATRETVEHTATINLVDLAGSERQKTANTQGKNREEGIQINQSLATLARVINDIASGAKFVNYRDSLLTMVLKDNLGGNSKTFMIATVSPIAFSYQESCATLTYAKDVRRIRNRPVVNRTFQTKANLLEQNAQLKSENERLKEQMEEWMRRWKRGVPGAAGPLPLSGDVSAITMSLETTPSRGVGMGGAGADGSPLQMVALSPVSGVVAATLTTSAMRGAGNDSDILCGNHEALIAATGATGLTAPLIISSHRRYANIAGIGGSCVEGGVIRVTSLVRETARLWLADVLHQGTCGPHGNDDRRSKAKYAAAAAVVFEEKVRENVVCADDQCEVEDKENAPPGIITRTPPEQRLTTASLSHEEAPTGSAYGDPASPSPLDGHDEDDNQSHIEVALNGSPIASGAAAGGVSTSDDFGFLEFERVSQRSCEQRFYVRFVPSSDEAAMRAVVDIQINGKSVGADARRELRHGDVVCAYIDGTAGNDRTSGAREQSLLAFHYVDPSCLARTAAKLNHATLSQIAVSVDLPRDMKGLTLDDIQQLQRDRVKLLDLVQQQKQTIDFQCQQQQRSRDGLREASFVSVSPSPEMVIDSPVARSMDLGSAATPALVQRAALEAFCRTSVSPSIRARSQLPADLETEELLRRAQEQSQSQARLESAIDENRQLHRAVAGRNATLEALARRLAELEAGGSPTATRRDSGSPDSSSSSSDEAENSDERESDGGEEAESVPRNAGPASISRATSQAIRSLSRVSVSSSDAEEKPAEGHRNHTRSHSKAARRENDGEAPLPILRAQEVELPQVKAKTFFEGAEGARERYKAAVREAALNARIAELEALIDDLHAQIGMQEGRLRVARDDTLEQEMLREQVELERDALLRELAALRAENAELSRDNEALEVFLKRSEDALAAALAMSDEELMRKARTLTEQIHALKAVALLWKRRAMKYIAMGYGEQAGEQRLAQFPWEEVRFGAAAESAKALLRRTRGENGGGISDDAVAAVDAFEQATAVESVLALEAALQDLEGENRRLQNEIARYEQSLLELRSLIDRLRGERGALEKEMANSAAMDEEERRRLQRMLDATNQSLAEAERNSRSVQQGLEERVQQSRENARQANKKHDQLLAEQRAKMREMEEGIKKLQDSVLAKDEELRTLLQYMGDNDLVGIDGAVRDMELRNRIEDLIAAEMKSYDAPTGYCAFPTEFRFSEEMIALIRVCLRILLDRLKIELYVLNKQNLHRFGLLVPTVQLRPEAQFHTFMHDLRGVAAEVAGRSQRIGGKWSVSEADVLEGLVDHRRRRAGGALYGLLIWYDHWDLSPKSEHVAYTELIRNSDRIMQMARQVRQESLVNTNATSTLLMPIPSTKGKSESAFISASSRKKDRTISESCRILGRLSENSRRSNLATALNEASGSALVKGGGGGDSDGNGGAADVKPFSRSATALALSQNVAFSRTSSAIPIMSSSPAVSPAKPPRPTASGGGHALPLGPSSSSSSNGNRIQAASASSTNGGVGAAGAPLLPALHHGTTPVAIAVAGTPSKEPSAFRRVASAGVMPVSESDVAFVAGSDVEQASSINRFNYERRMSTAGPAAVGAILPPPPAAAGAQPRGTHTEGLSRRSSTVFGRCQTATAAVGRRSTGNGATRGAATRGHPAAAAVPAKKQSLPAKTSATTAFGRSQSTTVSGTRGRAATEAQRRSGCGGVGVALSPKPRTPVGAASTTKRAAPGFDALGGIAAAGGEERFAAPTSFYSPSIMEALRQRSHSASNRPSTGLKASSGVTVAGKRKKHATTASGFTRGNTSNGSGGFLKHAFEPTRTETRPRLSAEVPASAPSVSSMKSTTPMVPPLDFAQLGR